jgi:hypothetical protein
MIGLILPRRFGAGSMLRWMIPCCAMLGCVLPAADNAHAADRLVVQRHVARAAPLLPPGLPRPHYKARTTIVYGPPPQPYDEALISVPTTPLLLGSSTLPGYYGRAFDYDYQGAYYGGGGYVPYLFREPYACGVTGYC